MNKKQRVNYYLSTDLCNIKKSSTIKINELRHNLKLVEKSYISPFKDLLIKTNNVNKSFNILLGDIEEPNYHLTLCKNRKVISKNSVILRCMSYHRHWYNYYNRPSDINFDQKENKVFWRGKIYDLDVWHNRFEFEGGTDMLAFNDPINGTFAVFEKGEFCPICRSVTFVTLTY